MVRCVFGDTLVLKTCRFFRVSRKWAEGGSLDLVFYGTCYSSIQAVLKLLGYVLFLYN